MFHNIRILAKAHRVNVLSFVENKEEVALLKSVQPICESITAVQRIPDFRPHWFSLEPFMVREFGTPAMHEAVDNTLRTRKVDVIQCEYLQMAQYKRPGVFSILTVHEAYSANAYRSFQTATDAIDKLRLFSRWMSMLNYEISRCNAFNRVVAMTEEDATYLRSYARRANIRAIPIGIDADYFQPLESPSADCPIQMVFVGNFRHTPNVQAAEFLLKEVAPHFPEIQMVIAGPYAPEALQKKSHAIFTGYVADTRELFHGPSTIFIAPLFSGTGQRVKLLEAFAMGAAVITTSLGAAGFPIQHGRQALIADNPEQFRAATAALVTSSELRAGLGTKARQMILDLFTWDSISRQFVDLVEEARCRGVL